MPNVVANESHYPVLIRWIVHSGWLQDFMSVQLYREVANLDRHLMTDLCLYLPAIPGTMQALSA